MFAPGDRVTLAAIALGFEYAFRAPSASTASNVKDDARATPPAQAICLVQLRMVSPAFVFKPVASSSYQTRRENLLRLSQNLLPFRSGEQLGRRSDCMLVHCFPGSVRLARLIQLMRGGNLMFFSKCQYQPH